MYLGHHWGYRRPPGEPQLTANYISAFSDFLTNFAFSKSVNFGVDPEFTHITPALLDRIWDQDNRKNELLWSIGNIGSVYGDVFTKIAYEPAWVNEATGELVPGRVRILPLNPSFCFPEWHPHDADRMVRFKLKYRFWATSPNGTRGVRTYCVDDETEALTKLGWKKRTEILPDDEFLSIHPATKQVTWQRARKLNVFDYDGMLAHWKSTQFDAMTTPDHRWIMENWRDRDSRYSVGGNPYSFKTTKDVNTAGGSDRLILSGGTSMHWPAEKTYSDEVVELMAWVVNEGYYSRDSKHPNLNLSTVVVTQSESHNPEYTERIRLLTQHFNEIGYTAYEKFDAARPEIRRFFFSRELGYKIREIAPDKQITVDFLSKLTEAQATLFYNTCIDADGHRRKDTGLETWTQKDAGRIAAFQQLVAMLGMRSAVHKNGDDCSQIVVYRHERVITRSLDETFERYIGKVWCPTIEETGTWLARRGGTTYWTGNCEIITDDFIEEYVDDVLIDRRPNPLGIIPVVHIANKPVAASPWGLSDIIDIIPLNRTFNEVATDILDIINYATAPVTVITGAKASNLERGASKVWAIAQKDAKVENLSGGMEGLQYALEFLDRLKIWMHELMGVPQTALGQEQEISNTSGVALAIQYFPTMLKHHLKTTQYGNGIRKVSQIALQTLFCFEPETTFFDKDTDGIQQDGQPDRIDPLDPQVYNIDVLFPPPLPQDALVQLNEIQAKMMLDLESKKGALKELGEQFPDEKLQELWLEQVDDLKMAAAKRIINAQVDAAIIALTGIVPQDAGEPVQGAENTETKTKKPDGTTTTQTKQTTPGVQGPSAPVLPSLPGLGDLGTIMNDLGGQTIKDLVVQASGTKLAQRRIVSKNDND